MPTEKKLTGSSTIENPKRRIVEDLKIRNKDNMAGIAGEYFGSKFTYTQTFKMFEDYRHRQLRSGRSGGVGLF